MNKLLQRIGITVLVVALGTTPLRAQLTPEQAAEMLLTSARRAYNEKNYPFAAAKFKEFLDKFGSHKEVPAARYGLALSLLDGPERDYAKVAEQLNVLAQNKEFSEYPYVLYHLGLAQRGLGVKLAAQAALKPQNEAAPLKDQARQRFEEASKSFAAALAAFEAKIKPPEPGKTPPIEAEWAARARCDQAEMLLRLNKTKEAQALVAPFAKEMSLAQSRYLALGLYYHGFASFLLKDNLIAGRSLSRLTPFSDPVFGTHARYLLGRVHQEDGERPEALAMYEGVIADFEKRRLEAVEALKSPEKFRNDPEEKTRLEIVARGPLPDHVARSTFFVGVLTYEDGRFSDAFARFQAFVKQNPTSPLWSEAQLRLGFCQVQLKQFKEAVGNLRQLAEKEPRLADQALLWAGKAQVGFAADPTAGNPVEVLKVALDYMRKAAERAAQMPDPEAKVRRAEILMEMADVQQQAKLYREAASTYSQVLAEKLLPNRESEAVQRLATALHLAGDYAESDKMCERFLATYPASPLLPAVLFRYADNAYFRSLAAEKNPNPEERAREMTRWTDEAVKRYQVVVAKYPEFTHTNLAKYGLALAFYNKGDLEKAKEHFESIPGAERVGELAAVPYQLADVLIRMAPSKIENAVDAGKLEEAMKAATELLESFISASPKDARTPDAYLKLGHCYQRAAAVLAEPAEKTKVLTSARDTYEKILQQFPRDAAAPSALFERSKVRALLNDPNGAINDLRRFVNDGTLKAAPVAPMALLHLATLLRAQNQPAQAAEILQQCRQQHEANLLKDPARAAWVPLLQYHHGVALKEAGKRPEARAVFELVLKQSPDRPEAAEAALRWGQTLKEDGQVKITDARKKLTNTNLKPEETAAARKLLDDGTRQVRDANEFLTAQAAKLKDKATAAEARARMLYEIAWGSRVLAEVEIDSARLKIQDERWQKSKDDAARKAPPGTKAPAIPKPEILFTEIPVQPAEKQALAVYRSLIEEYADLPINADARFEFAELLSNRDDNDAAIKQLKEALDKEPAPELTDKIRVRLGAAYLANGDVKAAIAQLTPVAGNAKSAMNAQALYRLAECHMKTGDFAEAVKRLTPFRDNGPYQRIEGLSDRALLRLGHAYDRLKQWDQSRQAHEQVLNRFGGNDMWANEARYGIGWTLQNQGRFDEAVNNYTQVVNATATELGARAQLNIGLCRLAQKRYKEATTALLVVPHTYDYPNLSSLALLEAARACAENNQKDQAVALLERVLRDHPGSEQAEIAKKRLEELKKG